MWFFRGSANMGEWSNTWWGLLGISFLGSLAASWWWWIIRPGRRKRAAEGTAGESGAETRRAEQGEFVESAVTVAVRRPGPSPCHVEHFGSAEAFTVLWGSILKGTDHHFLLGEFHNMTEQNTPIFDHAKMPLCVTVESDLPRQPPAPEVVKAGFRDATIQAGPEGGYKYGKSPLYHGEPKVISVTLRFKSNQPFHRMVIHVPCRSADRDGSEEQTLDIEIPVKQRNRPEATSEAGYMMKEKMCIMRKMGISGPRITLEDLHREFCEYPGGTDEAVFSEAMGALLLRGALEEDERGLLHSVRRAK